MQTVKELTIKQHEYENKSVVISGWVKTNRAQKEFGFLNVNDGTTLSNLQVVYDDKLEDFKDIQKISVGSSVEVTGILIATPTMKQPFEVKASSLVLLGDCPEDFPIQPKRHTREFLREVAHLRPRTNLFNAVFRLRSVAAFSIHKFFQERDYVYVNTPLITANDGEGAGQMFQVTTLPLENAPKDEFGHVDYKKDFFARRTNLTVTGQLRSRSLCIIFKKCLYVWPNF